MIIRRGDWNGFAVMGVHNWQGEPVGKRIGVGQQAFWVFIAVYNIVAGTVFQDNIQFSWVIGFFS